MHSYILNLSDVNGKGSSSLPLGSLQGHHKLATSILDMTKTYSVGPRTLNPRICVSFPFIWLAIMITWMT
jgi:hypothetical protein